MYRFQVSLCKIITRRLIIDLEDVLSRKSGMSSPSQMALPSPFSQPEMGKVQCRMVRVRDCEIWKVMGRTKSWTFETTPSYASPCSVSEVIPFDRQQVKTNLAEF